MTPKIEHPFDEAHRIPRDESTPEKKADWDKIKRAAGHLDDETERAITDVAIAAVRQFRDETDREETRLKTNILRNRIRSLVEEARSCPKDTAYTMGVPR